MRREVLTIETSGGAKKFDIEVATTSDEKSLGLMFRTSLPDSEGMLFPYTPSQEITMWMKNTYIPLDMLFIDTRGKVVRIIPMTKPFSLDILSSLTPIKAVLELRGGAAARRNIRVGDAVIHGVFKARKGSAAAVHEHQRPGCQL